MGTILYFDMFSGISGDMCAGAFLDLGLDKSELEDILSRLPLKEEYSLSIDHKEVSGMTGTDFTVTVPEKKKPHRTMSTIEDMLNNSSLPDKTRETALRIFTLLAQAEGKVHNKDWKEVHFHEVGAVDSIVDIVACAFAIEYFEAVSCYSSPFHLGSGHITCDHGCLPVPVPAVLELTQTFPVVFTGIQTELTTPTGAAIIRALVESPGTPPPEFTISATGLGCGKKEVEETPNMLRIISGNSETVTSSLVELTTDIDDSTPEIIGYLSERVFEAGALDCTVSQILMKKGRPGNRVSILALNRDKEKIRHILFQETTTFGIREAPVVRSKLRRDSLSVKIPEGTVSCKIGFLDNERVTVSPEYEDCREIARSSGVPLKTIYEQAIRAAAEMLPEKLKQEEE